MQNILAPVCAQALALSLLSTGLVATAQQSPLSSTVSTISGIVLDPSGATLANAHLTLTSAIGRRSEIRTGSTGRFSVELLPGAYTLHVEADGFLPYDAPLTIATNRPQQISVSLKIAVENVEVTVPSDSGASTESANNRSALVLKGGDLDVLATRDDDLQKQLLAMAGGDGQHPPQVYVDGFSGGRFPPKSAIREVRINQNPFSAQYDSLGFGRIEVFTKPGSDKLHGSFQLSGNDASFNSRNPYTGAQPPYHSIYFDGSVDGPIGKKTSFFLTGTANDQQDNSVINAIVLNGDLASSPLSQAISSPTLKDVFSARLDRQAGPNHTLTGRYTRDNTELTNAGVGLLVLPSQAYGSSATLNTLQLGDTILIGPHKTDEVRFQYIRTRSLQSPNSNAPSIIVQGAFNGGGNSSQILRDNQDSYEFQNYFSLEHGKHFLRAGLRYRLLRDSNVSTASYNGQFIFPDIASYRVTQQGLRNGLSPAAIRAAGGGATQFVLVAGRPSASVLVNDLGAYADDEWKVSKNVTLNAGLRFESQTAIPDHTDPAPRLGLAWAIGGSAKKPPVYVLRLGAGLFYDRFASGNILQAQRQNGITQQYYVLNNPDFYPTIPSPTSVGAGINSTIYRLSPNLRSPYDIVESVTLERTFGRHGSASVNYIHDDGIHQLLSRNLNAPLPGTYDPADPTSGTRPLGGLANLYQFSSDGRSRADIFFSNSNLNLPHNISVFAFYITGAVRTNAGGAAVFPSNEYNLSADYGRSSNLPHQQLYFGFSGHLPFGIEGGPFLAIRSGPFFNITTGTDLNGDTQYNDRPTFATDLTRPSVVRTRYGNFDTNPIAGQRRIPINYATGPGNIFLQLQLNKSFKVGPMLAPPPAEAAAKPAAGNAAAAAKAAKPAKPTRAWDLSFGLDVQNLINHVNPGVPIGVLSSPFFGQSISLANSFNSSTTANRFLNLRSSFRF